MSYTALYRKFRPDEFSDVKGQDHIVTTLKNQIKANRIGHAYLFCGTRGTGKTTVAKIFAKAVNCEHPVDGSPCGECAMCRSIANGASMNVIEIDAASNNGVDNIREIREEVDYRPTAGKYKVYIIDEVHMLSIGAFNALLKTLEEPPEYVIFILATTESHKIPVTILSRCQRYDFKRIGIDVIANRLSELLQKEHVEAEDRAVRYVAKAGDGSMRDALSLLDQCIAFYLGQKLTYEHVLEVLGTVDTEVFGNLLRKLAAYDVSGVLRCVEELVMQGRELSLVTSDFTWYLRNLLLAKSSDNMEDVLDVSEENLKVLKEEAKLVETDTLMRYIRIFSELSGQLKYATQKRVLLEVAFIKLCRPQMETDTESLTERIRALEKKIEQGAFMPAQETAAVPYQKLEEEEPRKKKELPKAVPEDVTAVVKDFRRLIQDASPMLKNYLKMAKLSVGNQGQLLIVMPDALGAAVVGKPEHTGEIKRLIAEKTGREVEIEVRQMEDGRRFEEDYVDLEQIVRTEIIVEE
ncbi:DNA polymerase III subunit gamma/tau [Lachnoclostridium sp. An181]|uniref:DNA polymerase III subunit gamma/tau n=1 Tax=Lachnoclostridium sp. An181 TaxID=1965575 RepID=UPI000B36C480|nr:DNA polymerase III subunit gamma/tau [Lachnoclostridium sp. An181]OUP49191.1 DNA polymerase III subunit gamma/tau [Lachnoclostridium sp. An181]